MNEKVERRNKTLSEFLVAILLDSKAAPSWWSEIIKSVGYVLNRISKLNNTTLPYKVLNNKTSNLSYLKT